MSSIKLENILFIDIETAPIHYQYNSLSETEKELWDKKMFYVKDSTPEEQYAKAGIFAEFAKVVCIGLGFIAGGKFTDLGVIADEILQETSDPKIAISALLKLAFKDELSEKSYSEINEYSKNKDYYSVRDFNHHSISLGGRIWKRD